MTRQLNLLDDLEGQQAAPLNSGSDHLLENQAVNQPSAHQSASHLKNKAVGLPPIPALVMALDGIHLIEASAGTGKTWTLTALMVRLIVEKHYLTRQIIATTFTRAAAAELKLRVRSRFDEMAKLLKASIDRPQAVLAETQASSDLLKIHLLQTLNVDEQVAAFHRLRLALDSFDELFIGTLDSLCQKILNEFSFDIGQYEQLSISEQTTLLCQQVMHDHLRQWRSQQDSRLIELLVLSNQLSDVESYQPIVNTALNFLSAHMQEVSAPNINWTALEQLVMQVQSINIDELQPYLSVEGEQHGKLSKNRAFSNNAHVFPHFILELQKSCTESLVMLAKDSEQEKWLLGFEKIDGQFKKADDALKQQFLALPATQILIKVCESYQQIRRQLSQLQQFLQYDVIRAVRERLPQLLSEKGETTFSQQMRLLATRLSSEDSTVLAQHIRHRYPVALVDEFQDTNSDQDKVITSIWRQPESTPLQDSHNHAHQGCLVLVGDPKQAIYGFRGGDMLTYHNAKQVVKQLGRIHALSHNQRSIDLLVNAVDRFFQFKVDMGEGVIYDAVQPSGRKKSQLLELSEADTQAAQVNIAPLRLISLTEKQDEYQQVAWQIAALLQQSQQQRLQIQIDEHIARALDANDIAVLCQGNFELDQIQSALADFDIPVWRAAQRSVFEGSLAHDVAALMQVMLNPYHESQLRRALSSILLDNSLLDLLRLDQSPDELAEIQGHFYEFGEQWQRLGFLAAWQQLLNHFEVWQRLSRQPEAERLVVNLRHLTELLHQHSEKIKGQHHLLAWLMRQISHPQQREWELERRLSGQQGVQLMTIHKSKGLEFPIVFVPGLDVVKKPKPGLVFFEKDQQRMLGVGQQDGTAQSQAQQEAHLARQQAEQRRLVYVALTRASVRLYISVKAEADKPKQASVLRYWLPENRGDWPDLTPVEPHTMLQGSLQQAPVFRYKQQDEMHAVIAQPLPRQSVYAWGETSFSRLVNHQTVNDHSAGASEDLLIEPEKNNNQGVIQDATLTRDDEPTEPVLMAIGDAANQTIGLTQPEDLLSESAHPENTHPEDGSADTFRFSFPRGANAGDCLHQILEHLNPKDEYHWEKVFNRTLQQYAINNQLQRFGYPPASTAQMTGWFRHIVNARLPDGATLAGLSTHSQVHEFEFQLSLGSTHLNVQRIHALLAEHGVEVAALNPTHFARYLHGFIDLLYEHNGRFYVADYKSNYLGNQLADYQVGQMQASMTQAGYWLQAALYMVALHRYLKVRLADYQPSQHLGGAVYLYLRGMQDLKNQATLESGEIAQAASQTGVLYWQPEITLIEALDDVLGCHTKVGS